MSKSNSGSGSGVTSPQQGRTPSDSPSKTWAGGTSSSRGSHGNLSTTVDNSGNVIVDEFRRTGIVMVRSYIVLGQTIQKHDMQKSHSNQQPCICICISFTIFFRWPSLTQTGLRYFALDACQFGQRLSEWDPSFPGYQTSLTTRPGMKYILAKCHCW